MASVKEGRMTFQRILTYTLSSVTKKIVQVLFLAVGLVITGHAILTPMLMVLIMVTGDFLGMSLTTDNVSPSQAPNAWRIGNLTMVGIFMGVCELAFCTAVLLSANSGWGLESRRSKPWLFSPWCSAMRRRSMPFAHASTCGPRQVAACPVLGSGSPDRLGVSRLRNRNDGSAGHSCGILAAAVAFAFVADVAKFPVLKRVKIA
jgi:H+-transporting ATPase